MSADGPLFHKYNLSRTDGKPMGDAFVLELKDPYAADALVAYADACEVTHPELAESMREQYGIRRAAKDETMRTMRDQVRDTCTRAEKAEAERNRLRDALSAALEWAGPMGEAPVKARPEWFDKARNALAVTPTPVTGSGGEAVEIMVLEPSGFELAIVRGDDGKWRCPYANHPAPAGGGADTRRLNWLEANEASLVMHAETWNVEDPECEYSIWWNVAKGGKSISGHPLGDVRETIDAAMTLTAKPGAEGV